MADPALFGSALFAQPQALPIEPRGLSLPHQKRSSMHQLLPGAGSCDRAFYKLLCAVTLHPSRTSAFGRLRFAFGAERRGLVDIRIES